VHDLVVRNVRLPAPRDEVLHCLAVRDGLFSIVAPQDRVREPAALRTIDASARFANGGFVESHVHLEKAFLLDRLPRDAETLDEAISITADLKRGFTPADIEQRAMAVLDRQIACGVTAVRAHVEVDDTLGLMAVRAVLKLREAYADRLALQAVVFPQEGIFQQRTVRELMRDAMEMGADVVGGIPYNDPDPVEHLGFVFDLAQEFGAPVDVHIDLSDDPEQLDVVTLAELTMERGMQGRVSAGHVTSLASVAPVRAAEVAGLLAEAGVTVACLPLTDVFLNGRGDDRARRRGVTPVRLLREHGVNLVVSTNNIQNPFTPFGRADPLDAANMLAAVEHMGSAAEQHAVMEMLTTNAARATGMAGGGIEQGGAATFVVFDAYTEREVFLEHSRPWMSFLGGRRVAGDGPAPVGAAP
jgi:cytosine deaminase